MRFQWLFVVWTYTVLTMLAANGTQALHAQTFTVIHNFTNGGDGGDPHTGLTIDAAGNLYGTTNSAPAYGTVFKLEHPGTGWILSTLFSFSSLSDGAYPSSRPHLAHDGTVYGTTADGPGFGCGGSGCGLFFRLTPSPTRPTSVLAAWNESVLYSFTGGSGLDPQGDLFFDQSGNIYGTTTHGGLIGA